MSGIQKGGFNDYTNVKDAQELIWKHEVRKIITESCIEEVSMWMLI